MNYGTMVLQSFCDRYPVQHRKSNSPVSLLHICVDSRHILSWSSAAHAASSFNVTHGPAPSPQLLKIKREEMGIKGPKRSTWFPSSPYLWYLPPTLTCISLYAPAGQRYPAVLCQQAGQERLLRQVRSFHGLLQK